MNVIQLIGLIVGVVIYTVVMVILFGPAWSRRRP